MCPYRSILKEPLEVLGEFLHRSVAIARITLQRLADNASQVGIETVEVAQFSRLDPTDFSVPVRRMDLPAC